MDRDLLGGVELHPLVRLAIDTAAFSHVELLWGSRLMSFAKQAPMLTLKWLRLE